MMYCVKQRPGTAGAAAILRPQIPPALSLWLHVGPDTNLVILPRLTLHLLVLPQDPRNNDAMLPIMIHVSA
jgi:hypothetical protein